MIRALEIDGKEIYLTEVASNENGKLFMYESDSRINGAPLKEVKARFPEYEIVPGSDLIYNFLFEENGEMVLYGPDGDPIRESEL